MRFNVLTLIVVSSLAAAAASGCVRHDAPPPASSSDQPPRVHDIPLPRDTRVVSANVASGATLASVLRGYKVAEADIAAIVARAASVFDVRKLRTARPYRLEQANDGLVKRFEYEIDNDRFLRVARPAREGALVAEVLPIPKTRTLVTVTGRIDHGTSSLFAAMEAAGEAVDLSISLADIFNGEIDFSTDVQPGDQFEILVEKQYRDDHVFAGYGPILAAEFDNAGRRYRAVRFAPPGGGPGYYDEHGVSMRRFFLHSPLKFEPVVTSGFSHARMHPILRELRPHLGVDYKAPIGAPVIAVADGVVVEAGMNGGAGRMVHLRHVNGFETEYLHLSTITVRAGAHVRQGDMIGRVGMSGLATGPHLDYRLKKNGAFINPLTAQRAMPPADPIPMTQRTAFEDVRDRVFAQLGAPAPRPAVSAASQH
jgi:murein DD-endopeptidase MepM/ murein hydrolase activator NlpD